MKRTGAHHLGLATYDYDGIVDFYTRVLGWEIAWQDLMAGPDGIVFMKTEDDKLLKHRYQPGNPIYRERRDLAARDAAILGMSADRLIAIFGSRELEPQVAHEKQ